MRDSSYTDPAAIRATYQARGRNRKLNISKVEGLGIRASQISPTQGISVIAGSGVITSGLAQILDPTYYADPGATYSGGTYQDSVYNHESIDGEFRETV